MQRPHMSTGAWIFATAVTVAAITAPSVYAAATSTVAIGNATNGQTATVDSAHQLVTVEGAPPSQTVHAVAAVEPGQCGAVYTPPRGKAIVLTEVTYEADSNQPGELVQGFLDNSDCTVGYDYVSGSDRDYSVSHSFPTGLALPGVYLHNTSADAYFIVYLNGYLVPASAIPPASTPAGTFAAPTGTPAGGHG